MTRGNRWEGRRPARPSKMKYRVTWAKMLFREGETGEGITIVRATSEASARITFRNRRDSDGKYIERVEMMY